MQCPPSTLAGKAVNVHSRQLQIVPHTNSGEQRHALDNSKRLPAHGSCIQTRQHADVPNYPSNLGMSHFLICGRSPKNGEKRKRALSGASLAAAMANHPHVLFDDEGVGRSPRSVAAKARYCRFATNVCFAWTQWVCYCASSSMHCLFRTLMVFFFHRSLTKTRPGRLSLSVQEIPAPIVGMCP